MESFTKVGPQILQLVLITQDAILTVNGSITLCLAEVWADICCPVLSIFLFLSFVCFVTYIFRLNKKKIKKRGLSDSKLRRSF